MTTSTTTPASAIAGAISPATESDPITKKSALQTALFSPRAEPTPTVKKEEESLPGLGDWIEVTLASLLLDFENSKWVFEELSPDQLTVPIYRQIYRTVLEVEKSGQQVGIHTVSERLAKDEDIDQKQAALLINTIRNSGVEGELRSAVDAIKNELKIQRVSSVLRAGSHKLATPQCDPGVVAGEIAQALDGLTGCNYVPTVSQQDLNKATLLSLTSEPAPIFSTGFAELDKKIGGLSPSRTYMVGARTGVGKSAFLLNLLHSLGRQNIATGFVSLEMDRVAMNKRLFGIVGRLESSHLKHPVSNETKNTLKEVIDATNQWKVYWSDKRGMTLTDLKSKLSQFARQGCQVAFVDYIQRVFVDSKDPRHLQVALVAKTLADLAERLNMAIVVATQLNREGAKADGRPELHNISESTVIEESADVIILLSHAKKDDESQGRNRPITLNVAKNRHGVCGYFDMYYCGRQFRFSESSFCPLGTPPRDNSVPASSEKPFRVKATKAPPSTPACLLGR